MIKVTTKGKNPVLLTPKVFNKMLHLPTANKPLKVAEEDTFLASQVGGANILREFLLPSANMSTDLSTIDITLLQEPYLRLFMVVCVCSWVDSRLHTYPGQHCMHCTLPSWRDAMFDWAHVISDELCFQLSNYLSTQSFCMDRISGVCNCLLQCI
jgi:hypothetical protein